MDRCGRLSILELIAPAAFILACGCGGTTSWQAPAEYRSTALLSHTSGGADRTGVAYTYRLRPIVDTEYPFGLQEFYQRKSRLVAAVSDVGDAGDSWCFDAEYALPAREDAFKLLAGAFGGDSVGLRAGIDWQVTRSFYLSFGYASQDETIGGMMGFAFAMSDLGETLDDCFLLAADFSSTADETVTELTTEAKFEYFANKSFSAAWVGTRVITSPNDGVGDSTDETTFGCMARYWTGPAAFGIVWNFVTPDDGDVLTVSFEYRF